MYTWGYRIYQRQTYFEIYKYLIEAFTRPGPFEINIDHFISTEPMSINFCQDNNVLILGEEDIDKLSTKKLYLILHCWCKCHGDEIIEILSQIKSIIEKNYSIDSDLFHINIANKNKKDSEVLLEKLIKKLPEEIALQYYLSE